MEKIKLLSIVVPAYKQEKTIREDLTRLSQTLDDIGYPYEIIVVVDGILDATQQIAERFAKKRKNIHVFGYKQNNGKGYAIKYGILHAKGDVVGFIDAGMDIHTTGINKLLDIFLEKDADIVIGSKLHPESHVKYPFARTILSWGYRILTRIMFGLSVRDTQVGIKFFRGDVAQKVFPRVLVKAFAFDIEVLALAYNLGYRKIYEGPIHIRFNKASSITSANFWRIILLMLWDTAAVFYRLKIIHYYSKNV